MSVWQSGLYVLSDLTWAVSAFLLVVIWGQILIFRWFQKLASDRLTRVELFALGTAGAILPFALAVILFAVFFDWFGAFAKTAVFVTAIAALFFMLLRRGERTASPGGYWINFLFAVSIFLHLAFLQKAFLPSYFDSAEHYRIARYFSEYFGELSGVWPLTNYYHIGYHLMTASFSEWFHVSLVDSMLVFGQVMISLLPFSLFFMVRRETRSNAAALFTSLLAGFGWHMPGHAVNWGKYPALLGLLFVQFVMCVAWLMWRDETFKRERKKLFPILVLGVLISGFVHTRMLIVYAVLLLSLLVLAFWRRLSDSSKRMSIILVLAILALEIGMINSKDILEPLFSSYLRNDLVLSGLVLFLAVFSLQAFTEISFFILVALALLLPGLFVPINGLIPGYSVLVLLDRPFVQMILYVPLSILGGLGLAGLVIFAKKVSVRPNAVARLAVACVFGAALLQSVFVYKYSPSECCQIVGRDDLTAINWLDENLPKEAEIVIASEELFITTAERVELQPGLDGGIWITPLTSRATVLKSRGLKFDQPEVSNDLCNGKVPYVYVGGEPQSFDNSLLESKADWYQVVLSLPDAKIYKAILCE